MSFADDMGKRDTSLPICGFASQFRTRVDVGFSRDCGTLTNNCSIYACGIVKKHKGKIQRISLSPTRSI